MFNAETFLVQTVDKAMSTSLDPINEGEYKAVSQPITKESFNSYDISKGDRAGQKGYSLNIGWKIDDARAGEQNGRIAYQRHYLDVTADGAGLDFGKGKNVSLGKLREVLGQNKDGMPWQPTMLGSQVALISVKQDPDKNDSSKIYSRVDSVAVFS